jgi:hypothetical protein
MKCWAVVTPPYIYTDVVCEYGGPSYEICDSLVIEARTARDAIKLAVKLWLSGKEKGSYCWDQKSDYLCPYTGLRAERVCSECVKEDSCRKHSNLQECLFEY